MLVAGAPRLRMVMVKPRVVDAEFVEVIESAEITAIDYASLQMQIEENWPGVGHWCFREVYDGDNYRLEVEGRIWRRETGDGIITPIEEVVDIRIDGYKCFNCEGVEIPSDFDTANLR
jgi:hypothetical protein